VAERQGAVLTNGRCWLIALVLGLTATACGQAATITQRQAAQEVQQRIHTAAAQLPSSARLEQQLTDFSSCDDPTDGGPAGRVTASTNYQIHDVPAARYPRYFELLRKWFERNGFRVLANDRQGVSQYLWVENNRDGFRLALQSNDVGGLYLTASSPCVWPNGTPG
jgi:hypothetical protein